VRGKPARRQRDGREEESRAREGEGVRGRDLEQHAAEEPRHEERDEETDADSRQGEDETAPLEVQFGPAHPIAIRPDGLLARIAGVTQATELDPTLGPVVIRPVSVP